MPSFAYRFPCCALDQSLTRSQKVELKKGGADSFPSKGEDIYKEIKIYYFDYIENNYYY
jgi:hypothetical protein